MVRGNSSSNQEVDYNYPKSILNNLYSNENQEIPLEEVLGSKGRVKILKLLATEGELNISKIVQNTHLNHASTGIDLCLRRHTQVHVGICLHRRRRIRHGGKQALHRDTSGHEKHHRWYVTG